MSATPFSLIVRLQQPGDHDAWPRFVELYTPLLVFWARRLGLQDADAADLVQDVFAVLLRDLPRYQRQPGRRFRAWLWTVTHNKHRDRLRKLACRPGDTAGPLPDSLTVDETGLIDEEDSDIQYFYTSRLPGEPPEGVDDIHFHPAEPRELRVSLSWGL